jgi:hypothetical protein
MKKLDKNRALKKMLMLAITHSALRKLWNRFDRDKTVRRVMKKFVLKFWLYALRMRRRIKRYGQAFDDRNRKFLKCHLSVGAAFLIRPTMRDRAITTIKDFLSVRAGFIDLGDRINRVGLKICLVQRFLKLR